MLRHVRLLTTGLRLLACGLLAAATLGASAAAEETVKDVVSAVVRLTATIPPEARTARSLGMRREGSGVAIDDEGLVLTIGYLILEASEVTVYGADGTPVPAEQVAYDHESGFGLVRAKERLNVKPIRLGSSADLRERAPVLAVSHGGLENARGVFIASRREFAGYWEYLLDRAIFTTPPYETWSGAALIAGDGRLVGIGSLIVPDAYRGEVTLPGNMFVPIDLLKPILVDLLTSGHKEGPRRPWLGMFSQTVPEGAVVTHVAPGGPAEKAGIKPGDVVTGISGEAIGNLSDLYRKVWSVGEAGSEVAITVRRDGSPQEITVTSGRREDYLRLRSSY